MGSVRTSVPAALLTFLLMAAFVWWSDRPVPTPSRDSERLVEQARHRKSPPSGWWQASAANQFTFFMPDEAVYRRLSGIDSLGGTIKGAGLDLRFDYGQVSTGPSGKLEPGDKEERFELDGHDAIIRISGRDVGLFVPSVHCTGSSRLSCFPVGLEMVGTAADSEAVARAVTLFKSIEFQND